MTTADLAFHMFIDLARGSTLSSFHSAESFLYKSAVPRLPGRQDAAAAMGIARSFFDTAGMMPRNPGQIRDARFYADGIWNPGVESDNTVSSSVIPSGIPSNMGDDR